MTLQTSGAISLSQIHLEFVEAPIPYVITNYYGRDPAIPESGTISFSDFYGTKKYQYARTTTPAFYWFTSPSYTCRLYWNGSQLTSGFSASATTLTVGDFTYTRYQLEYTTYIKGTPLNYYSYSRKKN